MVNVLRRGTLLACLYEACAIPKRSPLPPITDLCRPRRWLAWVIVGGVALHLFLPTKGKQ